jgi:hypothetical protein
MVSGVQQSQLSFCKHLIFFTNPNKMAGDAAVQILQLVFTVASSMFWLAFFPVAAVWLCCGNKSCRSIKRRRQQTQSSAHVPMIQDPAPQGHYANAEFMSRAVTEETAVKPDQEPTDELGMFRIFASRFGFPSFLAFFLLLWSAFLVFITLLFRLIEELCAINSIEIEFQYGNICPSFRAQVFELAWPHVASLGNPLILWFHCRRISNPVSNTLASMLQFAPERHGQFCKYATRASTLSLVFSVVVSIAATGFSNKKFANDPFLLYSIFLLPSHIMVATFAFIFYITRHRLRSFLSLVHFAHSSGNQFAHISVNFVDDLDIPTTLKTLSCQDAMLCEWTSIAQHSNTDDCAKWMRLQLHRLWMTQIRQANAMVGHHRTWLGFQALVVLVQLIIFAVTTFAFRTTAVTPLATVFDVSSIQSNLRTFLVAMCPVSALLFLALTRLQIDQVCLQIEAALEAASAVSDSSTAATLQKDVCNGGDSLGALLTFCKASSENALKVFGLHIDFLSLLRYFYYIGVTFGLVITSISIFR